MITTMIEHRVNGNRLIHAPTLLDKAKETYREQGLVISYSLVYNMFPGIDQTTVEKILNETIPTYDRGNTVIYFLEKEEIANE
jgi:hypothetical protein